MSVCNAVTFESLRVENPFLLCGDIFRVQESSSYIKVIRSTVYGHSRVSALYQLDTFTYCTNHREYLHED